ncbi:MAG TPA: hypothetical protein VEV43_02745 [Actinomycetota bacterium]|nr:hypothetical protein [Actinomycetota bacterium]
MARLDVELIEHELLQHPAVERCVVVARRTTTTRDPRMVAYVTGRDLEESVLKSYVESHVFGFVLPEAYVVLDQLPLGPNGKVDRNALPDPFQFDRE